MTQPAIRVKKLLRRAQHPAPPNEPAPQEQPPFPGTPEQPAPPAPQQPDQLAPQRQPAEQQLAPPAQQPVPVAYEFFGPTFLTRARMISDRWPRLPPSLVNLWVVCSYHNLIAIPEGSNVLPPRLLSLAEFTQNEEAEHRRNKRRKLFVEDGLYNSMVQFYSQLIEENPVFRPHNQGIVIPPVAEQQEDAG